MSRLVRTLGPTELFFNDAHTVETMIVTGQLFISGPLNLERLQEATHRLFGQHPILRLGIEFIDGSWWFTEREQIHFEVGKLAGNLSQLHTFLQDDVQKPLNAVLFRVSVFSLSDNQHVLVVTAHHALFDGASIVALLHLILMAYSGENSAAAQSLPKSADKLLEGFSLNPNVSPYGTGPDLTQLRKLIKKEFVETKQRRNIYIHRLLDEAKTQNLLLACRARNITLNALLYAAAQLAIYRIGDFQDTISIDSGGNRNIRSLCGLSKRQIGCYISVYGIDIDVSKRDTLWRLSEYNFTKFKKHYDCSADIHSVYPSFWGTLEETGPDSLYKLGQIDNGRTDTLHFSNLGRVSLSDKYGELNVDAFYFSAGHALIGAAYWLGASTVAKGIGLTFSTINPVVSQEDTNMFVELVMQSLDEALGK